jgi:hypothetical protein
MAASQPFQHKKSRLLTPRVLEALNSTSMTEQLRGPGLHNSTMPLKDRQHHIKNSWNQNYYPLRDLKHYP